MQSLTYVEIDVDRCSNTFGASPCAAALGVGNDAAVYWNFDTNSNNGWVASGTGTGTPTLTASSTGSTFAAIATTTDQLIFSPSGLSIDGATYTQVVIDWERTVNRTAGAWSPVDWNFYDGTTFFGINLSDPFASSSARRLTVIDMSANTNWAKTLQQFAIRMDSGGGNASYKIHSVRICKAGPNYKCYNSLKTCVDRIHLTPQTETLRFSMASQHYPIDIDAVPNITGLTFSPGTMSLGEDLGQRASLSVTFSDHPTSDTGPGGDRYLSDRSYDPFKQGTFWGKFRARYPFLQGRALRVIRGLVGQTLDEMDVRHYVIDSFDGPNFKGVFTITAKDVLKLADDDAAQAPMVSPGFLVSDITSSATSFTISPSGAGTQYPSSGYINIAGSEICAYTRSGDVFTITRGQFSTTATTHSAQDRVQWCLYYNGIDPADIIKDLFVTYAGIDASFINLANWKAETSSYLQRVYTALIAEPTGVNTLVSELIEQAALAIWWDDSSESLKLQVLRAISTTAKTFDENSILQGTLSIKDQPDARLSQVWTYYGLRNPLTDLDKTTNYRSVEVTVDLEGQSDYGSAAVKQIFSRWIPAFGRSVASRLNDIVLGRFKTPPRSFTFSLFRYSDFTPQLGQGYRLEAYSIQDETGARISAPLQITRLNPGQSSFDIEAQEMLFVQLDPEDLNDRVIVVDTNTLDFNLRTVHDSLYPPVADPTGITVTCIIQSGVIVGASSISSRAFDVGSWPAGLSITLQVMGRIEGAGGKGGGDQGQAPEAGGTALYTRYAIDLDVSSGEIWGGGGGAGTGTFGPGGAFVAGGGGGGDVPGSGGVSTLGTIPAQPGTTEAGGVGEKNTVGTFGPTGGAPGHAGTNGGHSNGGAAGNAVDGISFITLTAGPGDIRGAEVN